MMELARMSRESEWIAAHYMEIHEKYSGRWIPVCGNEIIAVGDTAVEVTERADARCLGKNYVLEKINTDLETV